MTRSLRAFSLAAGLSLLASASADAARFACGDTIGPGKTVTVENDLLSCRGVGLRIVGPVTVELGNGFVICDAAASGSGLLVEGKGAKVRGGRIVDCTVGVQLSGSNHRVTGVHTDGTFVGVIFEDARRSRVERSRIEDAEIGVVMRAASERNALADTTLAGIGFMAADVQGARQRLDGNEVLDADEAGFSVLGSRHAIVGNRARADGIAFLIQGSDHDVVGNQATFGGDGVGIDDGVGFFVRGRRLSVRGNVARRNQGVGFRFEDVEALRADGNRAEQNGDGGFVLIDVVGGELQKNVAFGNFGGPGIHVTNTGNRKLRMRENASTRHFAPFHDLTDDQLCRHTEWVDNQFERGSSGCIQ